MLFSSRILIEILAVVGSFLIPFGGPFGPQNRYQNPSDFFPKIDTQHQSLQELRRGPKTAPRGPLSAPRGPQRLPEIPKRPPRPPKKPKTAARSSQEAPRSPQEAPKSVQGSLNSVPRASREILRGPKRTQDDQTLTKLFDQCAD